MPDDNEPTVKITLSTIYHEVLKLSLIVSPLPAVVAAHEADLKPLRDLPAKAIDFEARIRVLERAMWKIVGFAVAGSAVISILEGLYYTSHFTK